MDFIYKPPTDPWLDILFKDEAIMVLNKPSELLSVPGRAPEHHDSLLARVKAEHSSAAVVHRLDLPTSGLMVVALQHEAEKDLMRQFRERQVYKRYIAVVDGALADDQGLIDLPLICDWPNRPKQIVDHEIGKPSQTRWTVLDRGPDWTRIELEPLTGRTHQLRVHMASQGHSILGDRFYATEPVQARASRLQLHAFQLGFAHPYRKEPLRFECAPDF